MSSNQLAFNIRISNINVKHIECQIGAKIRMTLEMPSGSSTTQEEVAFNPSWPDTYSFTESVTARIPSKAAEHRAKKEALESMNLRLRFESFRSKCCGGEYYDVGTTTLSLYTLASGPTTYKDVPMLHEDRPVAIVDFKCEVFQLTRPTMRIIDLNLKSLEPYMQCSNQNIGIVARYHTQNNTTRAETSPSWGGTMSRRLEQFEFRADFEELVGGELVIEVCYDDDKTWSTRGLVARARVPVKEFIMPGKKAVPFESTLISPVTGGAFGPIYGRVYCENGPDFAQMIHGEYTGSGTIKNAVYADDDVPFKPTCTIHCRRRTRSNAPPPIFGNAVPQTIPENGGPRTGDNSSGPAVVPPPKTDGDNPVVQLPYFWERQEDEYTGGWKFYNKISKRTVHDLPHTEEITYRFERQGYLGIQLDWNFPGRATFGYSSGRRLSGTDVTAVIKQVMPGLQAHEKKDPPIDPGFQIIEINGISTFDLDHKKTDELLGTQDRPLVVKMFNPYAVPKKVARYAKKKNAEVINGEKAEIIRKGKKGHETDGTSSANEADDDAVNI